MFGRGKMIGHEFLLKYSFLPKT